MCDAVAWSIGRHRIVCGDSANKESVDLALAGDDFDILVYDPPFEKTHLYSSLPRRRIGKKLVLFWDSKRFAPAVTAAISAGWQPYAEMIWDTVTSWLIKDYPLIQHRTCGLFGDTITWHRDADKLACGKHLTSVYRSPNSQCKDSAYQKPAEWFASLFAGIGGRVVLDMFGGSGTTLIACERLGISARVIEIDRAQCEQMIARIERLTGQRATLL